MVDCIGEGAGAPKGVGVVLLPKGDADDSPPDAPNGLLLLALNGVRPNGV